ncbi:glycosyltransferase, partial [bacterium]|nr:glycosyltransferase [bacterium]
APREQYIAVLVPCWHEAGVIGTMLKHNCYSIDYKHYFFFVGVYPNDPETIAEVQSVAHLINHVQCVIGDKPGPTNKAANLNGIYRQVKQFEKSLPEPFSIFVFHDSEDVVHPLSFKLYNYLIPRKDMIQIPVFPLEVDYLKFTHWLYADEFSESHTKDIVVRESINAHVPSAGVGTAFSEQALQLLVNSSSLKEPFSTDSLTEDYRTSLALRVHNLKLAFVTQSITRMRWQKRSFWGRGYVQKPFKEYIATRAMFPLEYTKAVRQKARWIIGIVFQEWDHSQWPKDWKIRYSLAHDRKSFVTHFINGFGYFVFLFWLIYSWCTASKPEYPSLYEQFTQHAWVWWLIVLVSIIMVERIIQRIIATRRIYGWIPALLSVPRAFYGNILNLHALMRAYRIYFTTPKQSKTAPAQPAWDKTDHDFPGRHVLVPYRRKLGDLLLDNTLINSEQLKTALLDQKSGERLGDVLLRLNLIREVDLIHILSVQYALDLYPKSQVVHAKTQCLSLVTKKISKWLDKYRVHLVSINTANQAITIAIDDPTNELLLQKIIHYFAPRKIEFKLIDPTS